jgi:glycosyltransferase involved in cell wall biosynthesis
VAAEREPVVLCYAGNPKKKGLDVIVQAWAATDSGGRRLVVTGIDADRGRAFLRSRKAPEPAGVEWAGNLEPEQHAERLARAEAYVSASRYEDYGIAQLEALAAGTPLVTTPSAGPYEALALARELEPALVAGDKSVDALAAALRVALAMPGDARAAYARRARELAAPYSEDEVARRLEQDVIPSLLG